MDISNYQINQIFYSMVVFLRLGEGEFDNGMCLDILNRFHQTWNINTSYNTNLLRDESCVFSLLFRTFSTAYFKPLFIVSTLTALSTLPQTL